MEYWRLRYCPMCALATTEIQINIQKMLCVILPNNGKKFFSVDDNPFQNLLQYAVC